MHQRWDKYYENFKSIYFSEYKFSFNEDYKKELIKVIKVFHFI